MEVEGPFEATETVLYGGYFAESSAQIGGCENHERVRLC